VSTSLGGFIASIARDYATGTLERNMPGRARELRQLLGRLGPSFVKIGQALSSRPDLLPQPYLESLSELQVGGGRGGRGGSRRACGGLRVPAAPRGLALRRGPARPDTSSSGGGGHEPQHARDAAS
jgi:hypothetical protein